MPSGAIELAVAYVSVVPEVSNVPRTIASAFGAPEIQRTATATGRNAGGSLMGGAADGAERSKGGLLGKLKSIGSSGGALLAGGVAVGVLGAGKALYDLGGRFDEVADTIRVGTGATGKSLDGLVGSAKKIATEVPASFEDSGKTVADLNTRLGLTGPALETLSKQFLEAGRMAGEAIDVNKMTSAFSAFGVKGADTSKTMDDLFRVSQATGVSMNKLAEGIAKGAPSLTQFGFDAKSSATLVGSLDKAGIDSNRTIASLGKGLATLAKEGKNPQQAFKGTVAEIERLTKSGKDAQAINIAGKLFGTKGASQFVAAVKSGKLNMSQLMSTVGTTKDTILGTGAETQDFAEKWEMFKNKILLKLEPIAERVFSGMGTAVDWLSAKMPAVESAFRQVMDAIDKSGIKDAFLAAMRELPGILSTVVGGFKDLGTWIWNARNFLIPLVAGFAAYKAVTVAFTTYTRIAAAVTKAWSIAQLALNGAMALNPVGLVVAALVALGAAIYLAWTRSETFRRIVTGAWNSIKDAALGVWSWMRDTLWPGIKGVWDSISGGFTGTKDKIVGAWNSITGKFSAAWTWVSNIFKNNWKTILGILTGPIGWAWLAIRGHWDSITGKFTAAKNWVIGAFKTSWNTVTSVLRWPIDQAWSGIKWAWDQITSKFRAAKDWVVSVFKREWDGIKKIFTDPIGAAKTAISNILGVTGLQKVFTGARDALGRIWDGLRSKLASPINAVIGIVNKPFINGFNNILSKVPGLSWRIPTIPTIKLATGGILPGYTPGRDVHEFYSPTGGRLSLSGGEPILRPEAGRVLGRGWVDGINYAARTGGTGGVSRFLGGGQAFAKGGWFDDIKDVGGKVLNKVKDVAGAAFDAVNPVAWLKKGANALLGRLGINGLFGDIAKGSLRKVIESAGDSIKGMFFGGGGANGVATFTGSLGGGVQRWAGVASAAMAAAGLPQSYLPLLLHRMQVESGGNPMAINLWDSNAKAGIPSKGLMQTIDPTFNAYAGPYRSRGVYDPFANIYAAIKYTLARYGLGGIGRAWGGSMGYAAGGIIPTFDNGGVLAPGVNVVRNDLGKPEPLVRPEYNKGGFTRADIAELKQALYQGAYDGTAQRERDMASRTRVAARMGGGL